MKNPEECLDLIMKAILLAGHEGKISIALDVAASGSSTFNILLLFLEFHLSDRPGYYNLDAKNKEENNPRILSGIELAHLYLSLVGKYPSILLHIFRL